MLTKDKQQGEYTENGMLKTSGAVKKHTGNKYKGNTKGTYNEGRAGKGYGKKGKK
jgi:hypothetical protein